jgi:hypothetical protein
MSRMRGASCDAYMATSGVTSVCGPACRFRLHSSSYGGQVAHAGYMLRRSRGASVARMSHMRGASCDAHMATSGVISYGDPHIATLMRATCLRSSVCSLRARSGHRTDTRLRQPSVTERGKDTVVLNARGKDTVRLNARGKDTVFLDARGKDTVFFAAVARIP